MGSRARAPEIEILLGMIDQAYDHAAWHGPNLRSALRGVTAAEAAWRPAPGRHNIRELVIHAAYWKYAVRRRIEGGKRGTFGERGSNWFAARRGPDEAAWRQDLARLGEEHRALCEAIAGISPASLRDTRKRVKGWKLVDQIIGVAFHDIYHAGQIQLLKRLHQRPRA